MFKSSDYFFLHEPSEPLLHTKKRCPEDPKSEERLLKRGLGGPYSFGSSWLGSNAQQRALSGQKKGEVDPFLTLVQALLKGSWSLCTLLS